MTDTTAHVTEIVLEPAPTEYPERARRLAAMLRTRPERHNQNTWSASAPQNECGTTACVGGWAAYWRAGIVAIDADGVMSWRAGIVAIDADGVMAWQPNGFLADIDPVRKGERWSDAGRDCLGLTEGAAEVLFYMTNDYEALAVLDAIADGRLGPDSGHDDVVAVKHAAADAAMQRALGTT